MYGERMGRRNLSVKDGGMALPLEDYAVLGDTHTAALVGKDGSIDWLCLPRFDSGACFAALLGTADNGRWLLAPAGGAGAVRRRYRPGTMVLETTFTVGDGVVRVIDFMPPRERHPDVVRIVEGVRGRVDMAMELVVRFDYGSIVPWVQRTEEGLRFVAGPDALVLRTPVHHQGRDFKTVAEFSVAEGERVPFVLTSYASHEPLPRQVDADKALDDAARYWGDWAAAGTYQGEWKEQVERSLLTLKALTYQPTGGIVAAATTSLPEDIGGVRNWDYRYCWVRDATFTLYALMLAGYDDEARSWRDWLLRAAAGMPSALQIMYGPAGERRLDEYEVPWLAGYEGSAPVRVGNAAVQQFQLDVYGELFDALHLARVAGIPGGGAAWDLTRALMDFLEGAWDDPDEGIWEVRGPRRHFTHSKVMAWVAFDRAVKAVRQHGLDGPADRWAAMRDQIHADVCAKGFDDKRGTFTQYYGSAELDASLLMAPLVGFLPAHDPRVRGTVAAIERELLQDGFVLRYSPSSRGGVDGLPGGEGAFLACTFWLADNYALSGRVDEARSLFERLLSLANDVGLLSEEYDVGRGRLVGNFPQAFSHVSLVNTANNLSEVERRPMSHRSA
jgi:GH15 family glucan-1,4-alpha-glucosidase